MDNLRWVTVLSDAAYSAFLRSLPLKGKGAMVMLHSGDTANYQFLSYAVVDMPMLSPR